MTTYPSRPDNRPNGVVWHYVEEALASRDFAPVSWALGSDWGVGYRLLFSAAEYKVEVYRRMALIYGPRPSTED